MFNQNRMNNNEISITTNLRVSASKTSLMTMRLWNDKISIIIKPAMGLDSLGVMQYSDKQLQTALTMDACDELSYKYENEILPIYNKVVNGEIECPEKMSVAIETGKTPKRNIIAIEMRRPEDNGNIPDMYFALYCSVDDNNIASEGNTISHLFMKKLCYSGYNPETGESEKIYYDNSDFRMFMRMITNTNCVLPIDYHNSKYMKAKSEAFGGKNNNYNGGNHQYNNNQYGQFSQNNGGMFESTPQQQGADMGFGMFGSESLPFN